MREGDILQGRFRLDRQIGRGGFARVFLCTDLTLGRQVAIKVLNPELLERNDEHDFLTRFRREARAVAALDHPNILAIYDYGEDEGTVYLVMPYVEGGTLYNRLAGGRALDLAATGTYLRQVAAALDYAHRRGIVHRDIKPQNMLLRAEDDRLLLADFGIAKVVGDTGAQTQTGAVGTIAYMAPEQFRGQISPALDIYALGCVLFQLLTGRVPFGGSTEQIIFGHISAPVPSLTELSGGRVSPTLQAVVERALRKDPAERFATAGELALAFDRALSDEPTRPPAPLTEMDTIIAPAPTPHSGPPPTASHTPPPFDSTRFAPTPISSPERATTGPGAFTPPPTGAQYPSSPLGADNDSSAPVFATAPAGGMATGTGAAAVPFPAPVATSGRRSRLPLFAGMGALILLLLLGGVALQRRSAGVIPQATAGSTLIAAAGTATSAATQGAPTATVPGATTAGVTPVAPTATAAALAGTAVPVLPPTLPPSATARTATPAPAPLRGTVAATFTGHTDHLRGLTWTGDGKTLISGAGDGTVRLWRADGTLVNTIGGRTFAVTSVALSPDGALLAVGADGKSNQAQIWRTDGSNSPVATLTGHTDNVTMVAWSPDGKTLATSSSDRTVRLWTAAGQPIRTLTGHADMVQNVTWAPDGQSLASASWDKTLRVWRPDGTVLKTLTGHTAAVFGVAWSPDGTLIASASEDKAIKLWRPDGTLVATLTGHTQPVSSVAWSPDGRTLASGSFDSTVRLWRADGAALATFTGHTDAVTALAWLPDGSGLASGSWDKTIRLWR
ncbi:MAG TPA: protein kinase [Thermomicrobiales bacterium]|jgi:serine/threonine protein kinase/sugar lactone lactonase YvrE